jgi:hypothetical protein
MHVQVREFMAKTLKYAHSTKSGQSAAKASSLPSDSESAAPTADWIPIGRAVFRFGIADSDSSTAAETPAIGASLFSIEAFKQSRSGDGASIREIANYKPKPPSLEELTEFLQDKTQARWVEIDQEAGRFGFGFVVPGGGATAQSAVPWDPDVPVAIDPRIEAEALFNKVGLVRVGDEHAAHAVRQNKAVREAIGLVWRRYMLPAFDRAVSAGRVALYARVQSPAAPLKRLPADVWPILKVLDWQYGIARDLEGTIYYSIHAAGTLPAASPRQKSIIADEKAATRALAKQLELNPDMTWDEALSICKSLQFRISLRGFEHHVWPDAREKAGLPRKAPPGRKKKSPR